MRGNMDNGRDSLRLAVFDVDGTLIDSQHSIVAAMEGAWSAFDLDPPARENVLQIIGLPLLEAVAILAPEQTPERHQALREKYSETWIAMREEGRLQEPLFPGSVSVLDDLEKHGWLLGVATGKARRGLDHVLARHALAPRFTTLQTSDVARGKPHPEMLERAMAETGVEPSRVAMIGDTTFDIQMARNAGTFAIGVDWGYHPTEDLWAAGAHAVIGDFSDLPRTAMELIEGGRP